MAVISNAPGSKRHQAARIVPDHNAVCDRAAIDDSLIYRNDDLVRQLIAIEVFKTRLPPPISACAGDQVDSGFLSVSDGLLDIPFVSDRKRHAFRPIVTIEEEFFDEDDDEHKSNASQEELPEVHPMQGWNPEAHIPADG